MINAQGTAEAFHVDIESLRAVLEKQEKSLNEILENMKTLCGVAFIIASCFVIGVFGTWIATHVKLV